MWVGIHIQDSDAFNKYDEVAQLETTIDLSKTMNMGTGTRNITYLAQPTGQLDLSYKVQTFNFP